MRQEVISQYPWLETQGVNAFDLRREAGDRKEAARRTRHIALGAEVSYNSQWSPRYPGKGAATLTDGYGGGWNYGDGAWQGFLQTADSALMPLDVTIDLGSVRRFRRVSLDFTQSSGAWVYYPHEVVVSTSEDGKAFTDVYRKTFGKNASKNYTVSTFVCPGNYRGRYVRVRARAFGAGEWLFTDEVRVE